MFKMKWIYLGLTVVATLWGGEFNWSNALTPELLIDREFGRAVFSPDASKLLLQHSKDRGIYIYDFGRKDLQELQPAGAISSQIAWSPDSKYLIMRSRDYSEQRGVYRIILMSIADGSRKELFRASHIPAPPYFSPSMEKVFFPLSREMKIQSSGLPSRKSAVPELGIDKRHDRFRIIDTDGNILREVKNEEGRRIISAEFNSGGSAILLKSLGGLIRIYDLNSGQFTDVGPGNAAKWGFKDKYVVFCRVEDDGHNLTSSELFVYDIEKMKEIQLTHTKNLIELDPDWSSDGRYISYINHGQERIYLIDLSK